MHEPPQRPPSVLNTPSPPLLCCTRPILPPECPGAHCRLGWAPGHVTNQALEACPGPPAPPTAEEGPSLEGRGYRKESLGPSSSWRGGMSCRPSRDFPSLSNKIPGEPAAGFGRVPAGDPPSPTRMPGSPGPGSSRFPGEPEGLQNSSLLLPGPVGKLDPSRLPLPTKDDSAAPQANHHPSSGLPQASAFASESHHSPATQAPPTPRLNLSTRPAWVLDLTSRFEGSQIQGYASLRLGLLRTRPCVLQL